MKILLKKWLTRILYVHTARSSTHSSLFNWRATRPLQCAWVGSRYKQDVCDVLRKPFAGLFSVYA